MEKVFTTLKRKGSEAMVEATLPLLYEGFLWLTYGFWRVKMEEEMS